MSSTYNLSRCCVHSVDPLLHCTFQEGVPNPYRPVCLSARFWTPIWAPRKGGCVKPVACSHICSVARTTSVQHVCSNGAVEDRA